MISFAGKYYHFVSYTVNLIKDILSLLNQTFIMIKSDVMCDVIVKFLHCGLGQVKLTLVLASVV